MAAEKISITVEEKLMKWARSATKKRRMTLSAVVAEALERQHQARERYLNEALSGLTAEEIERRTAEACREVGTKEDEFGRAAARRVLRNVDW